MYVAALVEREGEGATPVLERVDYSVEAWDGGARPQAPLRLFGFWRATYQPLEQRKQPLLGDAELLDLFEELAGATETRQQTFRFILALLLIRRRVLRVVSAAGGTMQVVRRAASDVEKQPMPVVDPGLDEQAIADAMDQLSMVVATEAPTSSMPSSPAAPGGAAPGTVA